MNNNLLNGMAAMVLLCSSTLVSATDPAPLNAGPFELVPELTVDGKFDDNIFRSFTDEQDDFITVVNPKLGISAGDKNTFDLDLEWLEGIYSDSSDDDYSDYLIDADVHLEANSRNMFDLYAGFHKLHEERGSGFSQGELVFLIDRPDTYEEEVAGAAYSYGSEESKGRVVLAYDYYDKEYVRFPSEQITRDRTNNTLTGTLYWGVSERTDILLEGQFVDIEYDKAALDTGPDLDSEETRVLLGVAWEATGKTTGTIKLGVLNKDFKDSAREDFEDEFTWDADIFYEANERHLFSLGAAQLAAEAVGTSNFINTEEYTASWNFQLNDLTAVYANARLANDKYEGSERDDDLALLEFGISRDIRRWLTVRASYSYDERDSNDAQLDYERNVFLIGVDLSL